MTSSSETVVCPRCQFVCLHPGRDCACVPNKHAADCRFYIAATLQFGIECDHGYDVCPQCDPCCGAGVSIPSVCPRSEPGVVKQIEDAREDAVRWLRERDAAWGDIDNLRRALGLRLGAGFGLEEMAACVRALNLSGDAVARAEELRELLEEERAESQRLRLQLATGSSA